MKALYTVALTLLLGCPKSKEASTPLEPEPWQQELSSIDQYISSYGVNWGEDFAFHGVVQIHHNGRLIYDRSSGLANRNSQRMIN